MFTPQTEVRSPDGRWLALPGQKNTVVVLDAKSRTLWATYYGHQAGLYRREAGTITALAWLPDGERLVSGSSDGSIHLWHARSGTHRRTLREAQADCAVLALTVSHEGMLRAFSGGEVGTWQLPA
jgi:WD40 repeat protein